MENENTWIEINKQALHNNVQIFKDHISDQTKICGVIKANAYGHGVKEVVEILHDSKNIDWWAVNSIEEALEVRALDSARPILVLTDIPHSRYQELIDHDISLIISNHESLRAIEKCNGKLNVHIKVDTGLGRLGVSIENFPEFLNKVIANKNLELEGVMSHFANAEDVLVQEYALQQIEVFEKARNIVLKELGQDVFGKLLFHMSASAATMLLPQSHYNMVRIGISLYGLWPSHETKLSVFKKYDTVFDLQPVLSWHAKIIHIKELKKGEVVGYGCTYELKRDSKIATIPVGYYEGYNRLFSNRADVVIVGQRCSVIGRVSMHMIIVDITDCFEQVEIGDIALLLGTLGVQNISAEELAGKSETINYDFVTGLRKHIRKKIV